MGKKLILLVLVLLALNGAVASAAKAQTGVASATTQRIWMMGRSTMAGWFAHWGSDGMTPVRHGRFVLRYKEIQPPPAIIGSVSDHLDSVTNPPTVFFKLCFLDFTGMNRAAAHENLKRNKTYIRRVYSLVVTTHHKRLLIGNALPRVVGETDKWLVWNHKEYNSWLRTFAASHPGQVYIFRQYRVLKDDNGNLRADYATATDDSHPNEAAYSALDRAFWPFLRSSF